MQIKQKEWFEQWHMFKDEELFLFQDWIYPNRLEDFEGKDVLECGCGGGQHTNFISSYARSIVAVDLNTVDIAMDRNKQNKNVIFVEDDIATMRLGTRFDIALCIGVIHHTDSPERTFENIIRHIRKRGRVIIWVYSKEGNILIRFFEPLRKLFISRISQEKKAKLARIITIALYPFVYSVYILPLRFLPYYRYFQNFRRLSFARNLLNVYDKINAPQVDYISRKRVGDWFSSPIFSNVYIDSYKGVSYRASAILEYELN